MLLLASFAPSGAATSPDDSLEGRDIRQRDSLRPKITATFPRESYRPRTWTRLFVYSQARRLTLQFFRAGLETRPTRANDVMAGAAVSWPVSIGPVRAGRAYRVRIGSWPTGVYFAKLTAGNGRIGFAPFVVRPRRLGEHRVAVVMPTQTWQAYNFRDDDGDGDEDTWYAQGNTARLGRPYLNRGVPYHYKWYDAPFLRWLQLTDHEADYLSDADLHAVASGRQLARRYALIIFPGHHEYVTKQEYDVTVGFRNRGGNLMFLSANNFFWEVQRRGNVMHRTRLWRDLGRPEAGLIGVQYRANTSAPKRGAWVVRDTRTRPWIFARTGLRVGSRFSSGGIEVDEVAPSSPRGVKILAEIPNVFRRGISAHMTYYERGGAKVFAAGAFTLAASIWNPSVRTIVHNLWTRLANDSDTGDRSRERAQIPTRRHAVGATD